MNWETFIENERSQPYFRLLEQFLAEEYAIHTIYPAKENVLNAFHYTPYDQVKVVLLGQDPYHGPNQAHGLSFSVQPGVAIPPSLQNIYKEQVADLGIVMPQHGYLVSWAKQGVFLLNTVLTVRAGQAGSHQGHGWEEFTDHVIEVLNQRETSIVYLLFGRHAMAKEALIDTSKHVVITAPHPSPLSAYRGFFGSHVFSRANQALADNGQTPINWELPQIISQ